MAFPLHCRSTVQNERPQRHSVVNGAIHRAIEYHASASADTVAVAEHDRALTYRELNARANVVARHLIACGLCRTNVVLVRMERSADLAVLLLAILKAGAAYCWIDPSSPSTWPRGASIVQSASGGQQSCLAIDLRAALTEIARVTPNLPVMTRGTDPACVLPDIDGNPSLVVPHAAVCNVQLEPSAFVTPFITPLIPWDADSMPFALWAGLMSGATVLVGADAELVGADAGVAGAEAPIAAAAA